MRKVAAVVLLLPLLAGCGGSHETLSCDQVDLLAEDFLEQIDFNPEGEGVDNYVDLVMSHPQCFPDNVVDGIAAYVWELEQLQGSGDRDVPAGPADDIRNAPVRIHTSLQRIEQVGGSWRATGTVNHEGSGTRVIEISIRCQWIDPSGANTAMSGGQSRTQLSVPANRTTNWSMLFSPSGGFEFSRTRTLNCAVSDARTRD